MNFLVIEFRVTFAKNVLEIDLDDQSRHDAEEEEEGLLLVGEELSAVTTIRVLY